MKAREWKIKYNTATFCDGVIDEKIVGPDTGKKFIHVIEYSAFEKAMGALKNWIAWEEKQIAKEGPYVGDEINALIEQGRAVIKDIEG